MPVLPKKKQEEETRESRFFSGGALPGPERERLEAVTSNYLLYLADDDFTQEDANGYLEEMGYNQKRFNKALQAR